jgi:aryl-phospho-beta-D-glucosidase BglC (GH1 family)
MELSSRSARKELLSAKRKNAEIGPAEGCGENLRGSGAVGSLGGLRTVALAAGLALVSCGDPTGPPTSSVTPRFLKASGTKIRDHGGTGSEVILRGANAGGWLVQESWMNPTDAKDQVTMRATFAARFGDAIRDQLEAVYEDNYWTEDDFINCRNLGLNCVRLPFTALNVLDSQGQLLPNAWVRLDWFVSRSKAAGLYVIVDLHGAPGSQNGQDHSGDTSGANLWSSKANQDLTVWLWEQVAAHFEGEPTVAGYDLLNEPTAGPAGPTGGKTKKLQWDFYDRLYHAVRAVDPDHMLFLESCWEPSDLPPPGQYGWENVVYEYHNYLWGHDADTQAQWAFADAKVAAVQAAGYPVPTLVGEFTGFSNLDAWEGILQRYNAAGWSWTTWTYKVTGVNNNWGLYNQTPPTVAIATDTGTSIADKWRQVGSATPNLGLLTLISRYASTR